MWWAWWERMDVIHDLTCHCVQLVHKLFRFQTDQSKNVSFQHTPNVASTTKLIRGQQMQTVRKWKCRTQIPKPDQAALEEGAAVGKCLTPHIHVRIVLDVVVHCYRRRFEDAQLHGFDNLIFVVGTVEEVNCSLANSFWKCISTQVRLSSGQIRVDQMLSVSCSLARILPWSFSSTDSHLESYHVC